MAAGLALAARSVGHHRRGTVVRAALALAALAVVGAVAAVAGGRLWLDRSTLVEFPTGEAGREGFDAAALDGLAGRMMARRTEAFLVARHGRLVLERYAPARWYWPVPERARRRAIASTGKAVVGATVLAIGACEGWLDPDGRVSDHVAAWRDDPRKRALTLRDLATHTSGLDAAAGRAESGLPEPAWTGGLWSKLDRRAETAVHRAPLVAERGAEMRYSNPGYSVYSLTLAKAAEAAGHGPDIAPLLQQRVLDRLGIPDRAAVLSYGRMFEAEGTRYRETGSGGRLTPRALVRVAQMVAAGGAWDGRQVVERRCLDDVLAPNLAARPVGEIEADLPMPAPAAGWWSNANGAWPELPADLLVAAGAEHRVVVVVPSLDLVAVRLGKRFGQDIFGGDFWRQLRTELLQPLLGTVRPEPAAVAGT